MTLTTNRIAFNYKKEPILNDINFSVQKGKITAILGPNGVGKTTLLKCLNKILIPQNGEVRFKNRDIKTMTTREIAKQMSYVAQKSEPARVTVFDAVLMGRRPHINFGVNKQDLVKVNAVIEHLNLSHLKLKHLNQMSGGELQKVCIARALSQETELLLLDEPTSSLDLKNQAQLLSLIRHIIQDHHMACIMTMHDLNAAMRYADHYIFLKDRTIYSAGDIHDITPEMIEAVYGLKVDIIYHNDFPIIIPVQDSDQRSKNHPTPNDSNVFEIFERRSDERQSL